MPAKLILETDTGSRHISKDDMEEIGLAKAMKEGRTGEYINTEDFLKKLKATNNIHN